MPRFALDLNKPSDQQQAKCQWRVGPGYVPGEPNEGLTARLLVVPARLAEFDDSSWDICTNIRQSLSEGFTFAWYRTTVEVPASVDGMDISGYRVLFETNFDNYGEVWVNGAIDRGVGAGVISGINAQQRVQLSDSAQAGDKFVIACLVLNGPLAQPRGGIFMRYATLAFEATDN